ncbi:hypothetical protein [Robertkochia aurantiaca]|uniref:hypothetical protein n=1 Tax=Robertkochia aurantiaca TaxID=2873700 RepID=UPI001CCF28A7|nr:hypothetical protein [Robertkochia sp. 3YJGBD-33]
MKSIFTVLIVMLGMTGLQASVSESMADVNRYGYNNSIIFVEDGITFSVYPDGEFDFYIDNPNVIGAHVGNGSVGITFNAGFNYSPWVQYDDYGAVIQVENTPVYYDFYGRVSRIGNVDVLYNNRRVVQVGGLNVFYDPYGGFARFTGFINIYNRGYFFRPYHRFFVRPAVNLCLVDYRPYRRYYYPVRYTYYRPYRNNYRRPYAQIGRPYHYKGNHRGKIYQNDRRVAARNDRRAVKNLRDRSLKYEARHRNQVRKNPGAIARERAGRKAYGNNRSDNRVNRSQGYRKPASGNRANAQAGNGNYRGSKSVTRSANNRSRNDGARYGQRKSNERSKKAYAERSPRTQKAQKARSSQRKSGSYARNSSAGRKSSVSRKANDSRTNKRVSAPNNSRNTAKARSSRGNSRGGRRNN